MTSRYDALESEGAKPTFPHKAEGAKTCKMAAISKHTHIQNFCVKLQFMSMVYKTAYPFKFRIYQYIYRVLK